MTLSRIQELESMGFTWKPFDRGKGTREKPSLDDETTRIRERAMEAPSLPWLAHEQNDMSTSFPTPPVIYLSLILLYQVFVLVDSLFIGIICVKNWSLTHLKIISVPALMYFHVYIFILYTSQIIVYDSVCGHILLCTNRGRETGADDAVTDNDADRDLH